MNYGFKSDIGKKREINEDRIIIINSNFVNFSKELKFGIFLIADGMGGHNAGENASLIGSRVAAQSIIDEIILYSNENTKANASFYKMLLKKSILKANNTIFNSSLKYKEYEGMGTTLVVALTVDNILYLGNVGDSRAYRINENELCQLTKDHSLVQELLDSKKITEEEGKNHPQKNIVTRIVGHYSDIKVDTFCTNISYNDRILLCSDGLTDLVSDNEIKEIILNSEYPQEACNNLVMTANNYGGNDNISVILFSVGEV